MTLSIGSLKLENSLVMAPMAGITNLAFRTIVKRLGAGLVFSEMISAMGLVMREKKTRGYLHTSPDERPLAIQIFGTRPESMAEGTRIAVDAGADIVDINMGCPARKVIKSGAGGALLREPEKIRQIISAVRKACKVPLTAKIRAGWSSGQINAVSIAKVAEDSGVDALTIHPRCVTQGFSGHADWSVIRDVKAGVKVPVIGNGDVTTPQQALDMMAQTNCDAVMIGRGAVGNPWIFRQISALMAGEGPCAPSLDERRSIMMEHYRLLSGLVGETKAAKNMRGLLLWYTRGLPHGRRFRNAFTCIKDTENLISTLDQYFSFLEVKSLES